MCFWCFHVSVTKSTSWWNSCFKIYVECDTHRPPTSVIRYHQLGNTTSSAIKCRHQHLNAFSDTLVNTPRATTRKISRSPTPRPEARIPKAKAILGIESQEKSRFSHGDGGVGLRGWGRDVNVADGWCYARPNLVVAGLMETSYFATSKPSNDIQAYDHSSGSHAFYNNVPARKTVKPLGLKQSKEPTTGAVTIFSAIMFWWTRPLNESSPLSSPGRVSELDTPNSAGLPELGLSCRDFACPEI